MFSRKPDLTPLLRYCRKRRGRDGAEDTVEINITRWFVTLIASIALLCLFGAPAVPFAFRILGY
jgi:hypothetical protein